MRHWMLVVLFACGMLTTSCAGSPQTLVGAAPRIEMPVEARRPCRLAVLPDGPTMADLEIGYATRGAALVACDAARRLAVETHDAEHLLEAEAIKPRARSGAVKR